MEKSLTRRPPVRLNFHDGEIVVTPKDQDRFFISAEKAVEACHDAVRAEERIARFTDEFLHPLAQWCAAHQDRISACFVLMPESAVLPVFVVGATEVYDFDLTGQLSELSAWFEERGWSVQASQLPRCDAEGLRGYFNPELSLQVYG